MLTKYHLFALAPQIALVFVQKEKVINNGHDEH